MAGFGTWKPAEAIRATSFGVKYAPDGGPLVLAAGLNLKEDEEKLYAGLSYKLMNDQLTLSADAGATNLGVFDTKGALSLGEKVVFIDNPDTPRLEIGLTLTELALAGSSGDNFEFTATPSVSYDLIEKTARVKLGLELGKGIGEAVKDNSKWEITTLFGWSLKESVTLDPDDIGTGFVVGYKYGVAKVAAVETTTNLLYFGFKTSY
jgi:hypothetical protein